MLTTNIVRFDSLPSTNSEAARQAQTGAAEGLCVVAAEQTAGRGRLDRKWISPKNAGLYLSLLLRPTFEQSLWTLVPLMAAVSVHDTLQRVCELKVDIKWPNDIMVDEKKVCGILAETVDTPQGKALIVGIGINLNNDAFAPDLQTATSIASATGQRPDPEAVLQELVRSFVRSYQKLKQQEGRAEVDKDWCERSSYCMGKRVRVTEGCKSFSGTTRGIEPDGALRVETEMGELKIVRAADVSSLRTTGHA